MNRIELLNLRQREAIQTLSNHKRATIKAVTAFGKSFVIYGLVYELLRKEKIQMGDTVFVFSFTKKQSENLEKEGTKYFEIKGKNPLNDFKFIFHTYQSYPKGERSVDFWDEVDTVLTAAYSRNIRESPAKYGYGLSATNTNNTTVYRDKITEELHGQVRQSDNYTHNGEITDFINKGQLLEVLCPVKFEYNISQALEEGIISPFETTLIKHKLDTRKQNIKIWKTKGYFGSEDAYYNKREEIMQDDRTGRAQKRRTAQDMCRFLYNLPSKIEPAKRLISQLEGGTVVFGVDLALVTMVTPYTIYPKNPSRFTVKEGIIFNRYKPKTRSDWRHTKTHMYNKMTKIIEKREFDKVKAIFNSRREYPDLMDAFNTGLITEIGSSKAIGRGVTLKGVKNAVFLSYYSKSTSIIQWLGRILRYDDDKLAKLFIFNTEGTYENLSWLYELNKVYDDKGEVQTEFDLNIRNHIYSHEI